jgi:hypothetical protein
MKEAVKQAMWYNKICCEVGLKWYNKISFEVGLKTENKSPLHIHEDNEACISYSRNPVRHSSMKHLERELY